MNRPVIGKTDLANAPTTPMRIIMGIVAAFIYVMVLIGCLVAQIDVNETLAGIIGAFILIQEGLDVTQWGLKRSTDRDYVRAKNGIAPAVEVTADHATVTAETAVPPSVEASAIRVERTSAANVRDAMRREIPLVRDE